MITTTERACEADVQHPPGDTRIRDVQAVPRPVDLVRDLPAPRATIELVRATRIAITRILSGADPRLLVVIGPCSINDADAALEYAGWLHARARELDDALLIVMRAYVEKPRTRGGWKGLINDPHLDGTGCIADGLRRARALLLEINALGMPAATEFVDPITPPYIADLISWAAIGARTTESQAHRELASGLPCPAGFKNNTSGDIRVAVDAVVTAGRPHHCLAVTSAGTAAMIATSGNPDCHVVLRGGPRPNYDAASVREAAALLTDAGACPRVMVDCSHGNSGGDPRRQLAVARDVARQRLANGHCIRGLMAESYLLPGAQTFAAGRTPVPGLSVTDPCLGLDDTAALLRGLVPPPARDAR